MNNLENSASATFEVREQIQQQQAILEQLTQLAQEQATVQVNLQQGLDDCKRSLLHANKKLQKQEEIIDQQLSWKFLATLMLSTGLIISTLVLIGMQLIPPKQDSLLETKLEIIFKRIEEIRNNTKK